MSQATLRDHIKRDYLDVYSLRERHYRRTGEAAPEMISVRDLQERYTHRRMRIKGVDFKFATMVSEDLDPITQRPLDLTRTLTMLRLDVWVDGEFTRSIRFKRSKKGALSPLDPVPAMPFADTVSLRIYAQVVVFPINAEYSEEPPAEGYVDRVDFTRDDVGDRDAQFRFVGGQFGASLRIVAETNLPSSALDLVEEFQLGNTPGKWKHFDRQTVAEELRLRLYRPEAIDQYGTQFCGPTSLIHAMAFRAPRRYVNAVISLFEEGKFKTKYGTISASQKLRNSRPVSDTIASADWMLAATIRNDQNLFKDVEDDGWLAGTTGPSAMESWVRNLIGYERLKSSKATTWGRQGINFGVFGSVFGAPVDFLAGASPAWMMRDARAALEQGGVVFMMVNSGFLKELGKPVKHMNKSASDLPAEPFAHRLHAAGKWARDVVTAAGGTIWFDPEKTVTAGRAECDYVNSKDDRWYYNNVVYTISTHWIPIWGVEMGGRSPSIDKKTARFTYYSWGRYFAVQTTYLKARV